jgi:hypothetical protein
MKHAHRKFLLVLALLALFVTVAASQQPPDQRPPVNVAGKWTIYSTGGPKNRTETKFVEIKQEGNKLSGHFKGPYQSGGIEGTIEGHHIVFHTKTHQILNFRGHFDGDAIKGTWGTRGMPGEWEARRQ